MTPVFRFAPSPNGYLHLGHALSALLNYDLCRQRHGRFLLRIEDIDISRCRPEYEGAIYTDLQWLGLEWEKPVRRQSEHKDTYETALGRLRSLGLVYPAFLSRSEIMARVSAFEAEGKSWPRDPDGSPLYPTDERTLDPALAEQRIIRGERHIWRLDMEKALAAVRERSPYGAGGKIEWYEEEHEKISGDPFIWGDVVLWRWDAISSYHLSVVIDDALQGITHVVRGMDLYHATPIHRLLQLLLDLPEPIYRHHRLLMDENGEKLSKSISSTGLRELRSRGFTPSDVRRRVWLD